MTKRKRKQTSPLGNQNKYKAVDDMADNNTTTAAAGNSQQFQNMYPMGYQAFPPMSPPFNYYINGQEEPIWAKKLMQKIDQIGKDFSDLEGRINKKLEGIERSMNFMNAEVEEFRSNISKVQKEVESLKKENRLLKEEIDSNKDSITDIKCRSMRSNLLIHGIDEEKNEDCEQRVRNLLENNLGIDPKNIEIERSHRLGKYQKEKKRPIVTKFLKFKDKENIKKAGFKLKGTPFGISDQFPKEINDRRTILRKIEKEEKTKGRPAFLAVDRLYTPGWCYFVKEGKVNRVPSKRPVHPQRNENTETPQGSRQQDEETSISQVIGGAHEILHDNN